MKNPQPNQKQFTITFPEIPSNHPCYPLWLAAMAGMLMPMAGVPPIVILKSGRAIHLGSWCEGSVDGEKKPSISELMRKNGDTHFEIGTGHDQLTLWTLNGHAIELTVEETKEFVETIEIIIGKREPMIIIPQIVPPANIIH